MFLLGQGNSTDLCTFYVAIFTVICTFISSLIFYNLGKKSERSLSKSNKLKDHTNNTFDILISNLDQLHSLLADYANRRTEPKYKAILQQFTLINRKTYSCIQNCNECLDGEHHSKRLDFQLRKLKEIVMSEEYFYHKAELLKFKEKLPAIKNRLDDFEAIVNQIKIKVLNREA